MELLPGDIVVLGSDGLFDNMWDKELESIVAKYLKVKIFWRFCCAVLVRSGRHAHNEGKFWEQLLALIQQRTVVSLQPFGMLWLISMGACLDKELQRRSSLTAGITAMINSIPC